MSFLKNRLLNRFGKETQRGIAGLGWTAISQLVGMVLRLGSNLVLTRLLAPESFGLIGTALAFLTTLEWLSDLGVAPAVIRHPRGDDKDVLSSGWWLTVYRGFGLSAVAAMTAWPVALFYDQPQLAGILAVLAMRPALMSLRSPGMPRLKRAMNYRSVFIDEFSMTLGGTLVSVLCAFLWSSVWAIVAGTVAGAIAGIAVSYVLCPELPGRRDPAICRELWKFGAQVLVNTLVMALWMNIDRLLGLKLLPEKEMGLYAVAWNLAAVAEVIMIRACDVHFSMLSRLPDDAAKRLTHDCLMRQLSLWLAPAVAIAICAAPWVIGVLYDARYVGAKPLFLILMCRVLIRGVGQMQFQLLLSQNKIRIGTMAYVVALIVQAASIVPLTQAFGVQGLAISVLLSTTCVTVTQAMLSARFADFGLSPVSRSLAWMNVPLLFLAFA